VKKKISVENDPLELYRSFESMHQKRSYFRESEFSLDEQANLHCNVSEYDFASRRVREHSNNKSRLVKEGSEILADGGVTLSSPTEEVVDEYESYFLVSDPEIKYSKVCTLDQMLELILDEAVGFDFENVLGSFYHY
jgi:hypothetical protein